MSLPEKLKKNKKSTSNNKDQTSWLLIQQIISIFDKLGKKGIGIISI